MNTSYRIDLRRRAESSAEAQISDHRPPGIQLNHSPDLNVARAENGQVLILGDCFPYDGTKSSCSRGSRGAAEHIHDVARNYWGRFVIVAHDPDGGLTAIYRDPSGMIPCYYSVEPERVVVGTSAVEMTKILASQARIDWKGVADCLMASDLREHRTCIEQIIEVAPGEMVVIDTDGPHHQLFWDPSAFLGRNDEYSFEEAAENLRKVLNQVLATWCARYPRAAVSASGGFDSSAIAELATRHGTVELLHFYTRSPGGDERAYAEQLANHLDKTVRCECSEADSIDVTENRSGFRPRPSACSFTQVFDDASERFATAIDACAHFNGGGGDNVFGKLHSAYPLAELYRHTGLSRSLVSTAINICDVTGVELWSVFRQAAQAIWNPGRIAASWPRQTELMASSAISMASNESHQWLLSAKSAGPGQKQHLRNIARGIATTDYLNIRSTRPTIYPLLSQPVIELCLSIPTWFWFMGGRDRALARTAMQPFLPMPIINRSTKGAFDGLLYQIFALNRDQIFRDLNDGTLASHKLIDMDQITHLQTQDAISAFQRDRILQLHETEIWCRNWC